MNLSDLSKSVDESWRKNNMHFSDAELDDQLACKEDAKYGVWNGTSFMHLHEIIVNGTCMGHRVLERHRQAAMLLLEDYVKWARSKPLEEIKKQAEKECEEMSKMMSECLGLPDGTTEFKP